MDQIKKEQRLKEAEKNRLSKIAEETKKRINEQVRGVCFIYHMNFTKFRFNNYQEISRKKKIAFDYNIAIHNHLLANCKTQQNELS